MAPSTSKDFMMTVRLDVLDQPSDTERLLTWLSQFNVYVVYRENGEVTGKLHYQGYVVCGNHDASKIAKSDFHRLFKGTHKPAQRSFNQVKKVESYMRYVAKDRDLLASAGVSELELKKLEAESFKKGPSSANLVERCYEWAKQGSHIVQENVADWLVADCIERKARMDVRHLKCVKHTVMSMLSGEYRAFVVREICTGF